MSEVANQYRLKVYNNVPFPTILTLYMREITLGLVSAYKIINIKVCGSETLYTDPSEYSVAFDMV